MGLVGLVGRIVVPRDLTVVGHTVLVGVRYVGRKCLLLGMYCFVEVVHVNHRVVVSGEIVLEDQDRVDRVDQVRRIVVLRDH